MFLNEHFKVPPFMKDWKNWLRVLNLINVWKFQLCIDHMVPTFWTTLCFGQTYPFRSRQTNCSHSVYERGNLFFLLCIICQPFLFLYISNLCLFSCLGGLCNCWKQTLFDHFSWGYKVQKWTTSSVQKGNTIDMCWFW